MKKIMIATAVVLAGIAANATSYKWQWGTDSAAATKAFDESSDASSGTLYLIWGFSSTANATASKNALITSLLAVTDGNYANVITGNSDYMTLSKSASLTDGTLAATAFTEDISAGAKTYAYAVLLDKDASGNTWAYFGANKNAKGVAEGGTGQGNLAFAVNGTDLFKAGTFDSYDSAGWYQLSAVPEPTSGLLLLLGVAGLALRRRRA